MAHSTKKVHDNNSRRIIIVSDITANNRGKVKLREEGGPFVWKAQAALQIAAESRQSPGRDSGGCCGLAGCQIFHLDPAGKWPVVSPAKWS